MAIKGARSFKLSKAFQTHGFYIHRQPVYIHSMILYTQYSHVYCILTSVYTFWYSSTIILILVGSHNPHSGTCCNTYSSSRMNTGRLVCVLNDFIGIFLKVGSLWKKDVKFKIRRRTPEGKLQTFLGLCSSIWCEVLRYETASKPDSLLVWWLHRCTYEPCHRCK